RSLSRILTHRRSAADQQQAQGRGQNGRQEEARRRTRWRVQRHWEGAHAYSPVIGVRRVHWNRTEQEEGKGFHSKPLSGLWPVWTPQATTKSRQTSMDFECWRRS